MTPKALSEYRAKLPDCELAVYADIGSGTVLGSDSTLRYPQEYLDALCACAAELFAQTTSDEPQSDHVLFFSATGSRAFFRSMSDPNEALCCICAPGVDLARLMAESRAAMGAAASGGATA